MSETLRDLVVLLSLQTDNFMRSRTKRTSPAVYDEVWAEDDR